VGPCRREILKPQSNLRFSLDLFPDRFAIALTDPSSKPLTDHALLKRAASMQ
jgi:hypothetical protein